MACQSKKFQSGHLLSNRSMINSHWTLRSWLMVGSQDAVASAFVIALVKIFAFILPQTPTSSYRTQAPHSRLLELERLDTSLGMDVALVGSGMGNLIFAVVIKEEVQTKMFPEVCCCNRAGSSVPCDVVASLGFDIAKAEDLFAVADYTETRT